MNFYHLKLDLYPSEHHPIDSLPISSSGKGPVLGSSSTQSTPPQQPPQGSPTLSNITTRFRTVFSPFPQPRLNSSLAESSGITRTALQESASSTHISNISNSSIQTQASSSQRPHPSDYRFGSLQIASLDNLHLQTIHNTQGILGKDKTNPTKSRPSAKSKKMASVESSLGVGSTTFKDSEPAQGILRLFRDTNEITTGDVQVVEESSKSMDKTVEGGVGGGQEGSQMIHPDQNTAVCVLAVPSYMSPGDFLNFVGPVRSNVSHFRIIRDSVPNRFMVLIKFRSAEATAEFYSRYNGRAFSSLEPEICHVVYLKSIEIRAGSMPPYAFPFLNDDPFLQNHSSTAHPPSLETGSIPEDIALTALIADSTGLAELPTCPVCLERMDSSVTGLLTILCQHTFHCHCLSKWGEGSCPVCRYSQKSIRASTAGALPTHLGGLTASTDGVTEDRNECALCGTTENLWICLICGHIGCGRYQEKHAYSHYYETSHLYALELETQRVWDYAGDGYVHRLIQNKADGKLVELPSAMDGHLPSQHSVQVGQEKLDAIGLEYTYLLTSQLESQRLYFDAQMAAMTAQLAQMNKEAKAWEMEAMTLEEKNRELATVAEMLEKEKVPMLVKEKKMTEKRLEKLQEKLTVLERQYEEEKEMNVGLRNNQDSFKEKLQAKEAEILDLQDQVRDMMIYLDTQQKVEASPLKDELVNGTVGVVAAAVPPASASSNGPTSSPLSGHSRRKGGRK